MLYVPLDAEYASDPKIIRAGAMAELVYVRALALAKRLMEDGYIDAAHLPQLALGIAGKAQSHVDALVREGLWAPERDGWLIVAWEKRNMTKAEIEARRAKKREAAVLGNHERWHVDGKPSPECPHCLAPAIAEASHMRADPIANGIAKPEPEPKGEPEEEPTPLPRSVPRASTRAQITAEEELVVGAVFAEYVNLQEAKAGRLDNPHAWRSKVLKTARRDHEARVRKWLTEFDVTTRDMACALIDGVPPYWGLSRKASA